MIDHVVRCVCKEKNSNKSLNFYLFDLSYTKKKVRISTYSSFCHFRNVMSKSINVSIKLKIDER